MLKYILLSIYLYSILLFSRNKKFTNNFQVFVCANAIFIDSCQLVRLKQIRISFLEIKVITHFIYASYIRDYVRICISIA